VATDDLDQPLGQDAGKKDEKKGRFRIPGAVPIVLAAILALVLATFAGWALIVSDPLGGEPTFIAEAIPEKSKMPAVVAAPAPGPKKHEGPTAQPANEPSATARNTVTIIDGSTGKRQEVPIAAPGGGRGSSEQRLLEVTRHGSIPKIGPDGQRPADAYARPRQPKDRADGPRVAIIVSGLGVSANVTQLAMSKLPTSVTLGFGPYGSGIDRTVMRARDRGHEVLLQVPMEPFDYPDNDPEPQTLLVSLSAEQNIDRLHRLMSRFQGYVGISNFMGARFTASEAALTPVMNESAKRGLIYVDDGAVQRSLAGQIASATNMPFAKADITIDSVPTPANVDRALARLEAMARERGIAVGVANALPISIERIAAWAKAAESRGIVLVPISIVAAKPRPS
jgi:polysaccharide deacetylase 2 family uncharacterized protein YibQ